MSTIFFVIWIFIGLVVLIMVPSLNRAVILKGFYGEQREWVEEMIENEDSQFIESLKRLSKMDRREIDILAESKQDLRRRVIHRRDLD